MNGEGHPAMRIAIVTDAWVPQVNGVVRTLQSVTRQLAQWGHELLIVSPDQFYSLPCPTYPEIRLALTTTGMVGSKLAAFDADAIHLSTEGPLCVAARRWCLRQGLSFTTAFHTQFPDYVARRTGLSADWFWPFIRRFHAPAAHVMVSTDSIARQLAEQGIGPTAHWGRGVDLANFGPNQPRPADYDGLAGPILLYVGRIAVEKNVEAFLAADVPGSKVIVGDGPQRMELQARFPDAHFLGPRVGADLAAAYAHADAFVFPSRTDTFGLVMIEALASGTPVAAYPVTGPVDIVTEEVGALRDDLGQAIAAALTRDRAGCAAYGAGFTWERSAEQFLDALVPVRQRPELAA